MSTPDSKILICSGVPLDSRYKHTIYFDTFKDQIGYFSGKAVKNLTAYSIVKRHAKLKVQASFENAQKFQYVVATDAYQSDPDRTYFYFINQIDYINDETVELDLELDLVQTYMFCRRNVALMPSFIERHHVRNDAIGAHTVDEGLDTGEYKINTRIDTEDLDELAIVIMATFEPKTYDDYDELDKVVAWRLDGRIYSGLGFYAVDMSHWGGFGTIMTLLNNNGVVDGIVNLYMYPKALLKLADGEEWGVGQVVKKVVGANDINVHFTKPETISEYVPKNNKLWCYPYNFLYLSNNLGGSAVYMYERFSSADPDFVIQGCVAPDGGVYMYPKQYNTHGLHSREEGLALNGFPTCAWNADTYKIWLAQNQAQHSLGMVTAVGSVVAGGAMMASGNLLGSTTVLSGVSSVASQLAERKDRAIQPPQARGSTSPSLNAAKGRALYTMMKKQISGEYARIIDEFFTMYGYKVNIVDTPSMKNREAFTYVKTNGCNLSGYLNNADKVKLEEIFDNGITFWVNGDKIGDYTQSNNPL